MKTWLRLAVRLYPAAWRDRYGVEFQAMLDESTPRWQDLVDILDGGLRMHLTRAHPALIVAALSLVGAFVAGAIAFNTAERFASMATINIRPAVPASGSATAWLEQTLAQSGLVGDAFSRDYLMAIERKYDLYPGERSQPSAEALVDRMRADIGMQLLSPSVVQVSFASADARKAKQVTDELTSRLVFENFQSGRGPSCG